MPLADFSANNDAGISRIFFAGLANGKINQERELDDQRIRGQRRNLSQALHFKLKGRFQIAIFW